MPKGKNETAADLIPEITQSGQAHIPNFYIPAS